MNKVIFSLYIVCCLFAACSGMKKTSSVTEQSKLAGNWELCYIYGSTGTFESLYPNGKPSINFDTFKNIANGNTSCNYFNEQVKVEGNQISFTEPIIMTKMLCLDGNGETIFLEALTKITSFSIGEDGKTLYLNSGDIEMMRLTKK